MELFFCWRNFDDKSLLGRWRWLQRILMWNVEDRNVFLLKELWYEARWWCLQVFHLDVKCGSWKNVLQNSFDEKWDGDDWKEGEWEEKDKELSQLNCHTFCILYFALICWYIWMPFVFRIYRLINLVAFCILYLFLDISGSTNKKN